MPVFSGEPVLGHLYIEDYNRPVQKCNLSDPRRALVYGRFLRILFIQWRLVRGGRYGSADPEIYLKRTQFKTVHLYFFFLNKFHHSYLSNMHIFFKFYDISPYWRFKGPLIYGPSIP
jgi:hypothetical protein